MRVKGPDGKTYNMPDEATDEQITEFFGQPAATNVRAHQRGQGWRRVAESLVEAAPGMGVAAGSLAGLGLGPPGVIAGGALLGSAGVAARDLGRTALGHGGPRTAAEALDPVRAEFGLDAALGGVGEMGAQGLRLAGRGMAPWLMKKGLRPTPSALAEEPQLIEKTLKRRMVSSPQAEAARRASSETEQEIAAAMDRAATAQKRLLSTQKRPTIKDVADPIVDWANGSRIRAGRPPLTHEERGEILRAVREEAGRLLEGRTAGVVREPRRTVFTFREVRQLKQFADDAEKSLLRRIAKGDVGVGDNPLTAQVGNSARSILRQNPRLEQQMLNTRDLIRIEDALRHAESLPSDPRLSLRIPFTPLHIGVSAPAERLRQAAVNPGSPLFERLLQLGPLELRALMSQSPLEPYQP